MRDHIMFHVGTGRFAAPLESVEEAIDLDLAGVQSVPGVNRTMRGVFPLRGGLLPLFDPGRALGIPLAGGATAMVVKMDDAGARAAILVDDVDDLIDDLTDEEVRPPTGGTDSDGVVRGVVQRGGSVIILIDLHALVAACRVTERGERP